MATWSSCNNWWGYHLGWLGCHYTNNDFDRPFFLTYLNTALFSLYLLEFLRDIPACLKRRKVEEIRAEGLSVNDERAIACEEGGNTSVSDSGVDGDLIYSTESDRTDIEREILGDTLYDEGHSFLGGSVSVNGSARGLEDDDLVETSHNAAPQASPEPPLTLLQTARAALIFCPIWFAANYTYNKSLSLTSVSSSTVLSSTSGLGTLILGFLVGVDSFSFLKLLAVGIR
eukprot:TRINITY_DN10253_c0_g1_i1.p2 TRINITY_DN10253_c0_g1~~TRINITY_DN10253_c0_g1_i1.p2  ORF type:complete len:229 (+),score=20.68 TRINITY_DN10253_c0_g1_i1:115-801(+)